MVCASVRRDNPRALAMGIIDLTGAQTMLYLTCTIISSVDLAHYGVSRAIDWESVDCDTMFVLKAIKSNFKGSYDKQNLTRVVISYEIYKTRQSLVS